MFKNSNDESVYNVEAFLKRDLPTDRLMKQLLELAKYSPNVEELVIDKDFYEELEEHIGPKFPKDGIFFGPSGKIKVVKA